MQISYKCACGCKIGGLVPPTILATQARRLADASTVVATSAFETHTPTSNRKHSSSCKHIRNCKPICSYRRIGSCKHICNCKRICNREHICSCERACKCERICKCKPASFRRRAWWQAQAGGLVPSSTLERADRRACRASVPVASLQSQMCL